MPGCAKATSASSRRASIRSEAAMADAVARGAEGDRERVAHRSSTTSSVRPCPPSSALTPVDDLPLSPCEALDTLMTDALASRPDVRAAELAVEAAGARVGLEKSRILTITATLDANGEGKQGFEIGPGHWTRPAAQRQRRRARARRRRAHAGQCTATWRCRRPCATELRSRRGPARARARSAARLGRAGDRVAADRAAAGGEGVRGRRDAALHDARYRRAAS